MSADSTTTNGHTDSYAKTEDKEWTPLSWRSKPIRQSVDYEDQEHLQRVSNKLQHLPPMVTPSEVFV
jgi:3-deoxy-7-phosphoheptulonate synthase